MSLKETKFGVKIVEVVSPVKFIALKSSLGCPNEEDETYTYKQLDEELNVHYNNWTESPVSGEQPYRPTKIGELVAVWQVDRRHWYRGSIKALYARQQFREAVVYLIDEARDVKLKVIRYLKPEFARFPWRSVTLRLDQLAPITLQLEIGATLAANNRVANKWDEHALTFVQQTIKDHRKFNFVSTTTDGGWHVGRLYMSDGGRHNIEICLNDLLVEKQYATYADCGSLDLGSPNNFGSPDMQAVAQSPVSSVQRSKSPNEIEKLRRHTDEMLLKDEPSLETRETRTNNKISRLNKILKSVEPAEGRTSSLNDEDDFVSVVQKHKGVKALTSDREGPSCEDEASSFSSGFQPKPSSLPRPSAPLQRGRESNASEVFDRERNPGIGRAGLAFRCRAASPTPSLSSSSFKLNNMACLSKENVNVHPKLLGRGRALLLQNPEMSQPGLDSSQEIDSPPRRRDLPFRSVEQNPDCVQMVKKEELVLQQTRLPSTKAEAKADDHFDILSLGNDIPRQQSFQSLGLDDDLLENLKKMSLKLTSPSLVRLWPAMMKWRDVVHVVAPGIAKTASYLLPLVWLVLGRMGRLYIRLPEGKPTVLVLCSSWREAMEVYDVCRAISFTFDLIQVRLLHGGITKEELFEFGRNYDILVSTPVAFLRLVESPGVRLAGFERLSHLVLSDADDLLEQFPDEVEQIVNVYREAVRHRKQGVVAPEQIVVSSGTWTGPLCKFIGRHMRDVLFYCESFSEAWVYSGVATQVKLVEPEQRLEAVLELVQPRIASKDRKIVLCSSKEKDITYLGNVLNRLCSSTIVANCNMSCQQLAEARSRWKSMGRFAILVVNDRCLKELAIFDADWIIHFDVPRRSRSYFSIRFMCLLNHARNVNYLTKPISRVSPECEVHAVVTSNCYYQSYGLIKLMKRLGQEIPAQLEALCLGFYEGKETKKEDQQSPNSKLCYNLKSFGRCHNLYWCQERHLLMESLDAPSTVYPADSHVQMQITHVQNVNQYFGRVLKSKTGSEHWLDWGGDYDKLKEDLTFHFAKSSNLIRLKPELIKVGDVGAFQDDFGVWHRVQVVVKPQGEWAHVPKLKVMYLDEGFVENIDNSKLMLLPEYLREASSSLREIFLCDVAPPDKEREWFATQIDRVKQLLEKRQIVGKVALSAGNTLWLNPAVVITLTDLQKALAEFRIGRKLIKENLAVENPDHMTALTEFVQTVFPVVSTPLRTSSPEARRPIQPETSSRLNSQQPTIVEPHSTSDEAQVASNVAEAAPNVSVVTPNIPKVVPDVPRVAPDVPRVVSHVPRVTPDVPRVVPDVPRVTPDVPRVVPDVPRVVPDVPRVTPDVPRVTSDVPRVTPDVPRVATHVPRDTPDVPRDTPDVPRVVSHVPRVTPDFPRVVPHVPRVTSDVPRVTPDFPRVTPDFPRVTPDVRRVTPDIPRVATHVPRVVPHVPRVTSDVPRVTPDVPRVEPGIPRAAPDVLRVTPDVLIVTSDVPRITPDVPRVTCDVSRVAPQLTKVALKSAEVHHNVPKVTNDETQQMYKITNHHVAPPTTSKQSQNVIETWIEQMSATLSLPETPCTTPKPAIIPPSPAALESVDKPAVAVSPRPQSSLTSRGPSGLESPGLPQAEAAASEPRFAQLMQNQLENVYVSCLDDPHNFYVQKVGPYQTFLRLKRSLEKKFDQFDVVSADDLLRSDWPYCAFSFERRERRLFGRGEILSVENSETILVLNLDTGDEDFIQPSDVRRLDVKYLKLRFQGIPCRLHGVDSVSGDGCWEDRVGDRMWDLTFDRDRGFNKPMLVKALELNDGCYTVELFDSSGDVNVSVAETLLKEGLLKYVTKESVEVKNDNDEISSSEEQELAAPASPNVDNRVTPMVEWSERKTTIRLKIKVGGIKNFRWIVNGNHVHFRATVGDVEYELKEIFYAALSSKPPVSVADHYCLVSTFDKAEAGEWPRLLESRLKPKWLSFNFNDIDVSSDDDMSMLSYGVNFNPPAIQNLVDGVPGGMTDSSSSENSESDEYFKDSDEDDDYFKL